MVSVLTSHVTNCHEIYQHDWNFDTYTDSGNFYMHRSNLTLFVSVPKTAHSLILMWTPFKKVKKSFILIYTDNFLEVLP